MLVFVLAYGLKNRLVFNAGPCMLAALCAVVYFLFTCVGFLFAIGVACLIVMCATATFALPQTEDSCNAKLALLDLGSQLLLCLFAIQVHNTYALWSACLLRGC